MRSSSRILTRLAMSFAAGSALVPAPGLAEINVVASIKPVHSLVAGVMQGIGEPVLLVKSGGSEHGYSVRPSEARSLERGRGGVLGRRTAGDFPAQATASAGRQRQDSRAMAEYPASPSLRPAKAACGKPTSTATSMSAPLSIGAGASTPMSMSTRRTRRPGGYEHFEAQNEAAEQHPHGQTDMHIWLDPAMPKRLRLASPPRWAMQTRPMHRSTGPMLSACAGWTNSTALSKTGSWRWPIVRTSCSTMPISTSSGATGESGWRAHHQSHAATKRASPSRDPGTARTAERSVRVRRTAVRAGAGGDRPRGTSAKKGLLDPLGADLEPVQSSIFS